MTALFDNQRMQFQAELDAVYPGGSLELSPQEYPGPLIVRRSLTIEGHNATLWALKGPVLIVEAGANVHLRNLRIEVTGEGMTLTPEEDVAIRVSPGAQVDLDDVEVRGAIEGLPQEAGVWRYPKTLYLGPMSPSTQHEFRVRIATATSCKIVSQVSGIDVSPSILPCGRVELQLKVEQLRNDTFLYGRILLKTAFSKRWIVVSGHVSDASASPPHRSSPHAPMLWEPPDWDSLSQAGQSIAVVPAPVMPAPVVPAPVMPAPVMPAPVMPAPVHPVAPVYVAPPVDPLLRPPAQTHVPPVVTSPPVVASPQLPLSASIPLQISPAPVVQPPSTPSLPISPSRPRSLRHQDPANLGIFSKPDSSQKIPDATPTSSNPIVKSGSSLPSWAKSSTPMPPAQMNPSTSASNTPAPPSAPLTIAFAKDPKKDSSPPPAHVNPPAPISLSRSLSTPLTIAFAKAPTKVSSPPPSQVDPPAPIKLTPPLSAPLTIAFAKDSTKVSAPPAQVNSPAPKPLASPSLFPPLTIAYSNDQAKPGGKPPATPNQDSSTP